MRLAAAALSIALANPAAAQNNCAMRDVIVEKLDHRYGETVHSMGLAKSGKMLEVLASDEVGSFTIIITSPNGWACVLVTGTAFETVDPPTPGRPM